MPVIELATDAWTPEADPRRRRAPVTAAVVVLLVAVGVLTGPPPAPARPLPLAWEAATYDGFFWLARGGAFTVEAPPAGHRDGTGLSLIARDPATGRPRWSFELRGAIAAGYVRGWESLVSRFPPTPDLGAATVVLDTRSGQPIRAYPSAAMALAYLADEVAVVIDRQPDRRPDPPVLDPRDTGLVHGQVVTAIDLITGAVRWRRTLPAGRLWSLPAVHPGVEGITALPPGQQWMVTSDLAGDIEVVDLATGATIAHTEVGRLGPEGYVTALATSVLVRRGVGTEVTMQLFDPRTLAPRGTLHPPAIYAMPVECGARLCLEGDRTVFGLDTTFGNLVWRLDGTHPRSALPGSAHLVPELGEPLTLVDPGSGTRLPADRRWRVADPATSGGQVVVARPLTRTSVEVAVVDTDSGVMTTLGPLAPLYTTAQCLSLPDAPGFTLVACGDGASIRVWRTR